MINSIPKILFFLYLLLVSHPNILMGQDSSKVVAQNSIYSTADYVVSGLGTWGVSINGEKSISQSRFFIGPGFTFYQRQVRAVSLELNYLFFKKKHHLETGLGCRFVFNPQTHGILYSVNLGYKYVNLSKSGMNFKIGISPSIQTEKQANRNVEKREYYFFPRAYFGLGYSF